MKYYCINVSNLHSGGALQVAASFIHELSRDPISHRFTLLISTSVKDQLHKLNVDLNVFNNLIVFDSFGIKSIFTNSYFDFSIFESVFTLFGPFYTLKKPKRSIVGFAQPWIIFNTFDLLKKIGFLPWIFLRLKFFIQEIFFSYSSDVIIVEATYMKRLLSRTFLRNKLIFVVNNSFSSVFLDYSLDSQSDTNPNFVKVGYLGKNYPHKNLSILKDVASILNNDFGLSFKFYVTLDDAEWFKLNNPPSKYLVNIGVLDIHSCPSFIDSMDAMILPSLLECFSALPVESLVMKTPIFLSDRLFNTEIVGDFAIYFDPHNPFDIATKLKNYFSQDPSFSVDLNSARNYVLSLYSAQDRMKQYLKVILNDFS